MLCTHDNASARLVGKGMVWTCDDCWDDCTIEYECEDGSFGYRSYTLSLYPDPKLGRAGFFSSERHGMYYWMTHRKEG